HLETMIDELCVVKSMHTTQFNHAPAQLMMHTGEQRLGLPSMGAWATYGLGSENANLPGFMVLTSGGNNPDAGKSIWGSGYLPSIYQGVQCRSKGDPVLFLANPEGVSGSLRRRTLDAISRIDQKIATEAGDPETLTRIAQYEMAYRMQIHASDAFDISREPAEIHQMYGTRPGEESFANNCLLARRLAERGVRFIQLFDWGWDSHGTSPGDDLKTAFANKCQQTDQPIAALLKDLKQRGLLDETLVIWGGEFGRTPMKENRGGVNGAFVGRDHHPGAFTMWMAGGGVKGGLSHGETDPIGYEIVKDKVGVHDLHATVLQLLGFDHEKFTYPYQGANQRFTNITQPGTKVIPSLIA
ncbi:MAG: sulfatase, partial [Akkermansiaceae bacterium]|nr:sulfatase [Akkermansiaceae bacterium]